MNDKEAWERSWGGVSSTAKDLGTIPSKKEEDRVNHPSYYTEHPSGIECITITRHYCFAIGNAIKYLWRAGLKKEEGLTSINKEIEDLKKAVWYINDRIKYLESTQSVIDEKYGKKE